MSNLLLLQGPLVEPLTLAEVKAHLRIDGGDEDAILCACLVAARQACESYTGLSLVSQSWQLYLDRWPEGAVALPRPPVQAVLSVTVTDDLGAAATLDPEGYVLDRAAHPARLARRPGSSWPAPGRAPGGIEITYRAGYGDGWNDVPQALRQGVLMTVAYLYEQRAAGGGAALPPGAAALWRPYRMLRL